MYLPALYSNSLSRVNGNPFHSFSMNSNTAPSAVSFWLHISPFATVSSFSRVESSISTLITSQLHLLCCLAPSAVHPVKHVTWHLSPSLPATFAISMVSLILLPMPSPAIFQPLIKSLSNLRPWPQLNFVNDRLSSCCPPTHPFNLSFNRTVLCETSQGTPRPVLPSVLRHDIYDQLHFLSHPSIKAF